MKSILAVFLLCFGPALRAADQPVSTNKPPRAARSVHLGYPAPDGALFYNEAVVEESAPGSYFMACGWNTGYFGIQQLGAESNKVVIFSVWDQSKGDNANTVPLEKRVEVLFEGENVKVSRFGGEGTGGKSMFKHHWKIGETNRFVVQAKVEGDKTAYTGWLFLNDRREWKKLVTFRTFSKGSPLRGCYSFVEDFRRDGKSPDQLRRARYGNGWIKSVSGEWTPLTRARFTGDGTPLFNIDAGVAGDGFFLATGGAITNSIPLRTLLQRPASGAAPPNLDLP